MSVIMWPGWKLAGRNMEIHMRNIPKCTQSRLFFINCCFFKLAASFIIRCPDRWRNIKQMFHKCVYWVTIVFLHLVNLLVCIYLSIKFHNHWIFLFSLKGCTWKITVNLEKGPDYPLKAFEQYFVNQKQMISCLINQLTDKKKKIID